jgi:hypothetical protein
MFSSYSNTHEKPKTIHILKERAREPIRLRLVVRHRALNYHYKAMRVYQLMEAVGVENVVGVGLYLCMCYTVQEQPSCGLRISAVSKRGNKK